MKIQLPCRLGEVFETTQGPSGRTERLRLLGFSRGMQMSSEYDSPLVHAEPEHIPTRHPYVNYGRLLSTGEYIPVIEIEIPDRLLERHPLSEDGIDSKRSGELTSVNIRSGQQLCRYFCSVRDTVEVSSPILEKQLQAVLPAPELDEQAEAEPEPGLEQQI